MEKFIELLKNAGVTDTDAFVKQMKDNKIHLSGEENIDVRYGKLKTDHDGVKKQLDEANKMIETLKASQKTSDADKAKIAEYEANTKKLAEELAKTKLDSAIKVALLSAKAIDVDYLTYKLKEKGENLELDDQGNIKNFDDKLAGLRTQFPNQFEGTGKDGSGKKFIEKKLGGDDDDHNGGSEKISKEEFAKMGYRERLNLKHNDPDSYNELVGNTND